MRTDHGIRIALFVFLAGCGGAHSDRVGNNSQDVASGDIYNFGALAHPGSCMDVQGGGTTNGTQIEEWTCNGTGAQSYELRDDGAGAFYIVNTQANKCVDVQGAGTANGTKIQLYDCNGTAAQTFYTRDAGNGFVYFVNTNSNKCLDVAGNNPNDGTVVQLYDCNQTAAQKWNPTVIGVASGSSGGSGSSSGGTASSSGGSSGADAGTGAITAQDAILQMQRGINIGNTFDAPGGETTWGNPEVQDYYFDDYKIAGFKAVRIPVTWDQHTGTNAPYSIDEPFISRVEQVVDWGLSRGLFIIVNAHHEAWLKNDYSASNVARFGAIWTQISTRFKDKSNRLVFEILNEPEKMTVENLNSLNTQILGTIRQTNPTRLVVYAGTNYSSDWDLAQVNVPGNSDPYLIANFHCYSPWSFVSGGPNVIWGSQADKDAITGIFDGVAQFVASKGIPAMVNEFGAGPNHDYASRMAFYQTYVDNTISHGMAFFAWDDGGDFRTYDRQLPAAHAPGGKWVGDVKDVMTK